jgi:hypothetical protein
MKQIKIKEEDYNRLVQYGNAGEPIWMAMKRVLDENEKWSMEPVKKNQPVEHLTLYVNVKGLVPGKIKVNSKEESDNIISVLIDFQNIPGVPEFKKWKLVNEMGKVIDEGEFDNYM